MVRWGRSGRNDYNPDVHTLVFLSRVGDSKEWFRVLYDRRLASTCLMCTFIIHHS